MSDEIIIRHCSPTLAGLKTGNLFVVDFTSREEMQGDIRSLNKRLVSKGLRILPLRFNDKDNKGLLYLYRPENLKQDLSRKEALSILKEMGYACENPNRCIVKLMNKLKSDKPFPHEIGLFLGYPPEDVRGFIENKAQNYKCLGTWKVYGDAEKAQETFCKFKKCTDVYNRQWHKGKSIEQLTVAV